jgi:hypothetical protein
MARLCREPDVQRGLRTLPTARAIIDLIRRAEESIFTAPATAT